MGLTGLRAEIKRGGRKGEGGDSFLKEVLQIIRFVVHLQAT